MKLYILVFICSISNPVCDANTARVYQSYVAPDGIIICATPAATPIVQSVAGPDEREYIRTRCVLR